MKKIRNLTMSHRWYSKRNKFATFLRRFGFRPSEPSVVFKSELIGESQSPFWKRQRINCGENVDER